MVGPVTTMNEFAALVDRLYYLNSNNAKAELLIDYLRNTPDPDRGWAMGAIAGTLNFEFFKRRVIKELIVERVDPILFDLSYDYVGEMSETVAHLWSTVKDEKPLIQSEIWADCVQNQELPSLAQVVDKFTHLPKNKIKPALIDLLNVMTPTQRWALLKLGTKGLRIGVSARFLKKILAQYAQKYIKSEPVNLVDTNSINYSEQTTLIDIESVERVWHGVEPPYLDLLAWLEQKASMPDITNKLTFQPVMLAHPIDEQELKSITPEQWQAEWKFDGIRAQLVVNDAGSAIFSRTGDDISGSFPDLIAHIADLDIKGRFDGELLALNPDMLGDTETSVNKSDYDFSHIASFNQLQQRLNKKKPSKALMQSTPVGLIIYDALQIEEHDLREQALHQRTKAIGEYLNNNDSAHLVATQTVSFSSPKQLSDLKQEVSTNSNGYIEGLMLKHKQGNYVAGRPKGQWYKLKRDPKLIDAVIMYAQRGHGKRSSYYSDFTFGCWQDQQLLPIGKAYSGFTDEELKKLDNWVRKNTIGRFGPVKEVKKELVFEVAFDAVQSSNRHKSKVALRFPRIHRIRWDKPASEADELNNLIKLID
jgi:DNA ligase-1